MKRLCRFFIISFIAVSIFCFHSQAKAADVKDASKGIEPFTDVIKRNWDSWSSGKDSVAKFDLLANIAKPEYKAENAAALVALETYLRKNRLDSINRAAAVSIQDDKAIELYQKNVLKLQGVNRVLFAPGQPDFRTMAQGPAGDCYFFSSAGWIARYRSGVIAKAIRPLPDNTYHVVFPNGDEATVTAPTDSELAFNDSASTLSGGIWMPVLEKALGTILSRTNPKSSDIPDPTVAIDVPGIPVASIVKRWTGNDAAGYKLNETDRDNLKRALTKLHEKNSMAEALLLKKNSSHLPWDHVYAVMDFDPQTETLTMWNPLAYDFKPDGPDGKDNGYSTARGIFNIPLDDFMDIFSFLAIEKN